MIILTSLAGAVATAAPAWTWVDEAGHRHYSDRPVEGATQINLPDSQTFSRVTRPAVTGGQTPEATAAQTPAQPQTQAYTVFNILEPVHQQTLWNIGGNLSMRLDITPALQEGHRLDAILDGARIRIGATGPQLTIPDVFRGMHTIQAVIVDQNGNEVVRSLAITVMVQQTSILN